MDVSTHRLDHNGQMVPAAWSKKINIPFLTVFRIRIHWAESGSSILGWTPIRICIQYRVTMTKIGKNLQLKMIFFWSKITIYLSLGLHKERTSYRRSLQPPKRTSSTSKHEISGLFSILVGYFCPPGSYPDPESGMLHSECRCRTQPL